MVKCQSVISHLSISGLALIDELSIHFSPGFNVITGETGAGKSILIRALNLMMGGRSGSELVRQGRDSALVTGVFELSPHHTAWKILEKFSIRGEGEVLVRRQIFSTGKSVSWINDVPVTSATLKEIGQSLIDIFSQHENQRLMDASRHTPYVDRLGKIDTHALFERSREVAEITIKIKECLAKSGDDRNRDYLAFRFSELTSFGPNRAEFEGLTESVKRRESLAATQGTLNEVTQILESDAGVIALLKEAQRKLLSTSLVPSSERIRPMIAQLEELCFELSRGCDDTDPGDLEKEQERLFNYQDLMRKNGVRDVESLMVLMESLKQETDLLERALGKIPLLERELFQACVEWKKEAERVASKRRSAGELIATQIEVELRTLAMSGAHFEVDWQSVGESLSDEEFEKRSPEIFGELKKVSPLGLERAEFKLGANVGESAHPLSKIASGGELSRIMLALKQVLASGADMCVMVFDEIDSGISGRVADIVGQKIKSLSQNHQVLCISHLPQVCVYADSHLLVKKSVKAGRTESAIVKLSPSESEKEIARMLSGERVCASSLENAKMLLAKAHQKRREQIKKTLSP